MKCLFCKRTMKDDVFHVCPSRVPSMGRMGIPRNKNDAQQNAHLTPESLASSQAVSNASALEPLDGDTRPAQAQVA